MFLLVVIVFITDRTTGKVIQYFYFKEKSGLHYRTTYSIDKTSEDILIFGSSRANHHYHPEVFENILGLSYYNVGRDGNFIFYHAAILKGILKRYSPKIIILDFVKGEFQINPNSYDRLSSLLPYYQSHPEIQPIIKLRSKYEKIKLLSHLYPYNSTIVTIAAGNAEFNKERKIDIKGYVPLTGTWKNPILYENALSYYDIDSLKVFMFESFLKDCINSDIGLFIVCSPYYKKSYNTDYSIILAQELAKKYRIPFLDFSNNTLFLNSSELFYDVEHLNDKGAKVFSNVLIDTLNNIIENKSGLSRQGSAE